MRQRQRRGFRIDTQSPGFKGWVTRIWVAVVVVLVAGSCWYGRKAYVGYRQQRTQQALLAQQAAAQQSTTTQPQQAEAPPPVPEIIIPEIEPGNMRSVIAHNQAVRVAESLQKGGPVNMRKQLAESSTSGSQQDVTQSGGVNMREVLKSQKGSESGDALSVQPKDTGKKSGGTIASEFLLVIIVIAILCGLVLACFHKIAPLWARPVAVFVSGFVSGYLFFIHCIWMSLKPGMVVGLMVGLAFLWIYCGWGQPPESRRRGGENFIDGVKGQGSRLRERFNRWRERRNQGQGGGNQQPPQAPIVVGPDQGGDS